MSNTFSDLRVKLLRYSGVSVIAVLVTQSCLWLGLAVIKWPALAANIFAVTIGAVPAYLMNRSWVWGRRDSHSVREEILPFWLYNLLGLVMSTTLVALADIWFTSTAVLMLANLLAFGGLWVGKFFVLEKVLFK
ncbi:MAG: GtrA family protein [Actinomycetota bacterium]|nr:GtrA family protein [Actinomycetota bacterium]